jgi:hypothetical protein
MSQLKLSENEIAILKGYQQSINSLIWDLGELELRLIDLENQKIAKKEVFKKINEDQEKTAKELQAKYGEGNINLETGEFIPVE